MLNTASEIRRSGPDLLGLPRQSSASSPASLVVTHFRGCWWCTRRFSAHQGVQVSSVSLHDKYCESIRGYLTLNLCNSPLRVRSFRGCGMNPCGPALEMLIIPLDHYADMKDRGSISAVQRILHGEGELVRTSAIKPECKRALFLVRKLLRVEPWWKSVVCWFFPRQRVRVLDLMNCCDVVNQGQRAMMEVLQNIIALCRLAGEIVSQAASLAEIECAFNLQKNKHKMMHFRAKAVNATFNCCFKSN